MPPRPKSPIKRFTSKIQLGENGCWDWVAFCNPGGYGVFHLKSAPDRPVLAHRFAYEKFRGPIPEGACVLHKCDNRRCVNPRHLFLGSHKDNALDAKRKKRHVHGSNHGCAKLTENDVKEIRLLYASGVSRRELASRYGVTKTSVRGIVRHKTWRHVNEYENLCDGGSGVPGEPRS